MTRAWTLRVPSLYTLGVTAAGTALAAEPVRRLLLRRGRLDVPNHRSSHSTPVPRGGGIAALIGAATAAALSSGNRPTASQSLGVTVLAGLGWLDDITGNVPSSARLIGQFAVGWMAFTEGGAFDHCIGALATAGVVNAVNFMDGINGMSSLTALTWGVNTLLLDDTNESLSTLAALVSGAALGFLPYNAPQAHLFLGDVGSYALGAAMAAGILVPADRGARYRCASPLLLYATDVTYTLLQRNRRGEPIGAPHKQHIYQRLVHENGLTHAQVALLHAGLATVISTTARLPMPWCVVAPCCMAGAYTQANRIVRPAADGDLE